MIGHLLTPNQTMEVNVEPFKVTVFDDTTYGLLIRETPVEKHVTHQLLLKKEKYIELINNLAANINMCITPDPSSKLREDDILSDHNFLDCEIELSRALNTEGKVSWNDMIAIVKRQRETLLALACLGNEMAKDGLKWYQYGLNA
jgi:hypothetical protein